MNRQQVESWVTGGPQPAFIDAAEQLGRTLKNGKLTTSQIRQVFTRVKSIEAKGYNGQRTDFMMLKPYLAYAAGRQPTVDGLQTFKETITWAIDAVLARDEAGEKNRFHNFCKLFEAILAYHRASGGK